MLHTLLQLFGRSRRPVGRAVPPRRVRSRPGLEALEERWVLSTIGGAVYNDVNTNGLLDSGEKGIAGVAIQLKNSSGTVIGNATTDSNGQYQFTTDSTIDTSPHTKEVDAAFADTPTDSTLNQSVAQFDPSLGTLTSVQIINNGTLTSNIQVKNLDNSASSVTGTVSGTLTLTGTGFSSVVTKPSSTEQGNVDATDGQQTFSGPGFLDFGAKTAQGSDSVTLSTANGQDLSSFIGTGTINLTENSQATSSASGPGNLLTHITSSSSANVQVIYTYTPSNALPPGNYTVIEPNDPTGYIHTQDTPDNITPLPPSGSPYTIPVTLPPGGSLNNNFGETKAAGLSGFVYQDAKNDGTMDPGDPGIAGATVTVSGTDIHGNAVNLTQTTGADGSYNFGSLVPGTYTVAKTAVPPGYLDAKVNVGNQGGTLGTNAVTQITLAGGVTGANYNFGEVKAAGLSGFVYLDLQRSGKMDPGDPGIGGVSLTLIGTDSQGNSVHLTTQTASDGSYNFPTLVGGNYVILETPPFGYSPGVVNVGNLGGTAGTNQISVNLPLGGIGTNYDFGLLLFGPPVSPPPDTPGTPPSPPSPPSTPQQPAPVTYYAPPAQSDPPLTKRDFIGVTW